MAGIDNPPAFPRPNPGGNVVGMRPQYGMTLRDYYAGQALAGEAADQGGTVQPAEWIAKRAYEIADAMLAARSVEPQP